ncbi:YrhB domain-containing protein [Hymenobacter sp. M29]|uniref:YrhB domain-containing protein n=1 Tax=Hymenobacter mellowenesis TaxID=3063995 RepID=A0ABT9A4P6_9BACT|nr:YrhB domain-containing protein [Hymenobacter sp. M29]MDO7844815.1 YrhB domain-containing protein [Hymenobacter sp. M29]
MIARSAALQLAQTQLDSWEYNEAGDSLMLLAHETEETPYAWVVYYTSRRWYETRNNRYAIAGAGPFIVAKHTGRVTQYSSAYSTEAALEKYEEEQQLYGLRVTADLSSTRTRLLLKKLLSLSNQELLLLIREPGAWAARGGQQRLQELRLALLSEGVAAEVLSCFPA